MNREITTLDGVPIFGKAKAIAFSEGQEVNGTTAATSFRPITSTA